MEAGELHQDRKERVQADQKAETKREAYQTIYWACEMVIMKLEFWHIGGHKCLTDKIAFRI